MVKAINWMFCILIKSQSKVKFSVEKSAEQRAEFNLPKIKIR